MKNLFTNVLILALLFWQASLSAQNSTCATAATLQIDSNCGGSASGGGANAGDPTGNDDTDGNVCSSNYSGGDDFIFEYTATTTDALELNLYATNTWTGLLVTAGCPTTGTCFASSTSSATNESLTTDPMTIGETYYIHISTWPSPQSAGQFCLDAALVAPPMPPGNDVCAMATSIMDTDVLTGNTELSTSADGQTACNGGGGGGDCDAGGTGTTDFSEGVWFVYTSTSANESITVATDNVGTDFDTEIMVYEGSCGSLTCVGGDDDGGDGTGQQFDSKFCWVSTANFAPVDYYIYIDGHSGATGNYAVSLNAVEAALPVELTSFEGEVMDHYNMIKWETASEENTEMHVIERSSNGQTNWKAIGELTAAGNSFDSQQYRIRDMNPIAQGYYRLKSVDFDGYTDYSDIIMLERKIDRFEVLAVAPNPASTVVNIQVQVPESGQHTIRVSNTIGQTLYLEQLTLDAGIYSKAVDVSDFTNGIYIISIENGFESLVHKVVKQ